MLYLRLRTVRCQPPSLHHLRKQKNQMYHNRLDDLREDHKEDHNNINNLLEIINSNNNNNNNPHSSGNTNSNINRSN